MRPNSAESTRPGPEVESVPLSGSGSHGEVPGSRGASVGLGSPTTPWGGRHDGGGWKPPESETFVSPISLLCRSRLKSTKDEKGERAGS